MKNFVGILIMLPMLVYSTSYHTVTIDGTSDFATDEDLTTTSGGYTDYFTWDATNLYFGIGGSDADTENKVHFIYIDTDPQTTATSGTGTTSSIAWNLTHTLPFTANYAFAYKVLPGDDYYNLRTFTASWQSDQTFTGAVAIGTDMLEVSIPLDEIGNPSQVYAVIFMQNDDGSWTFSGTPSNTFTDGAGNMTMSHYYGYTLTSGISPDAGANVDSSLPVELSTFETRSSSKGVELKWVTDSEIENQGFIIDRAQNMGSDNTKTWQEIASFVDHKTLLGHGSTTKAHSYSFVDANVDEGSTYSYRLADIDYKGQRVDHDDLIQKITYVVPKENVRPGNFELIGLFPNPFNPSTTLSYSLSEAADLKVEIYNLNGELVWNYSSISHPAGQDYSLQWNGINQSGQLVSSGIYLVNIQSGIQSVSQKVTLIR